MTDPPDYNALAARYMALWQEHLTNAATDPAVADAMTRMMTGWQSFMGGMPTQDPASGTKTEGSAGDEQAPSDRPASAADTSGSANDVIRDLSRRIADLEERLAKLEGK